MNKKGKKLRLNLETIRNISLETLREAGGGATEFCTLACTRISRCVQSCPCVRTDAGCETLAGCV